MTLAECPVCYEQFHSLDIVDCGHKFCRGCVERVTSHEDQFTCPLCRQSFQRVSRTRRVYGFVDRVLRTISSMCLMLGLILVVAMAPAYPHPMPCGEESLTYQGLSYSRDLYCYAGLECCANRGCVPYGGVCCGDGYCESGYRCVEDVQRCALSADNRHTKLLAPYPAIILTSNILHIETKQNRTMWLQRESSQIEASTRQELSLRRSLIVPSQMSFRSHVVSMINPWSVAIAVLFTTPVLCYVLSFLLLRRPRDTTFLHQALLSVDA